jgi:alkylation response protein AidB-like acyl-CoA dehydrogenase
MRVKFPYSCGSYHEVCKEFLELALEACGYVGFTVEKQPEYTEEGFYVFDVDLNRSYLGQGDEQRLLNELRMADFNTVVIEK